MPTRTGVAIPKPKNWQEFEDLCCDLWRQIWKDPLAKKHGRLGQAQAGVDVYGQRNEGTEWVALQCKRWDSLSFKDIEAEVREALSFKPPLSMLTIATTIARDVKLQEEVRKLSDRQQAMGLFRVDIAFWEDIEHELSDHWDLVRKHYPQFFLSDPDAEQHAPTSRVPARTFHSLRGHSWRLAMCLSLLVAASSGTWFLLPAVGLPLLRRPTLAVLPLRDVSPDKLAPRPFPDSRTLSGLFTEILDERARVRVVPYAEAAQVMQRIPEQDGCLRLGAMDQIRKFIGADFIVSGSFERIPATPRLRLSLCLQRTKDGQRLALFDREFRGDRPLAAFGDDVTKEVLGEVGYFSLFLPRQKRFSESDTAVGLYFQGLEKLEQYEMGEAVKSLCQAKGLDSSFFLAGLALSKAWKDLGYDDQAKREADLARRSFQKHPLADSERERDWVEAQYHTLREDWESALEAHARGWARYTDSVDSALGLIEAQNLAGRNQEARETLLKLQALADRGEVFISDRNRVRLHIEDAIALMKSDLGAYMNMARGAAREAAQLQEPTLEARALSMECDALIRIEGHFSKTCKTAAERFRRLGDRVNEAKVYESEGHFHLDAEDPEKAQEFYERALRAFSAAGFQRGRADALSNIAYAVSLRGDDRQAHDVCEQALALATKIRSASRPEIANNCAYFRMMTGDVQGAARLYEEVLVIARTRGNRLVEAIALGNLAYARHAAGRPGDALVPYEQSIRLSREAGDTGWELQETLVHRARLLADLGQLSEARKTLEEALAPYSGPERARRFAESLCPMQKILGSGGASWKQILAGLSLRPERCETSLPPPIALDLPPPVPSGPEHC